MQPSTRSSPWRIPLVREMVVILLLKLVFLMAIKAVWFSAPTVPSDGIEQVGSHLLGTPISLTLNEEKPR